MGEMTLDLEGWRKQEAHGKPVPVEKIHFHVDETWHNRLEAAEVELLREHKSETLIDADPEELELLVSPDCGPLRDCQFRVYINQADGRGHFHLVGHRQGDNSLVYSNSVMVTMLT